MIDRNSPAFIAACDAFNAAPICPELGAEIALAEGIAAYNRALWQPIETAPRDETLILAWRKGWDAPISVYWSTSIWAQTALGAEYIGHGGAWVQEVNRSDTVAYLPTHWRPLPTPPEEV